MVHYPDGVPPNQSRFGADGRTRHATMRGDDGDILAEGSVNDAGFFVLFPGFFIDRDCSRQAIIEVDVVLESGVEMYGELDVTAEVLSAMSQGGVEVDITSTPIQVAVTARPATTTEPPTTTTLPATTVPTTIDPLGGSGEHPNDADRQAAQPPTTTRVEVAGRPATATTTTAPPG